MEWFKVGIGHYESEDYIHNGEVVYFGIFRTFWGCEVYFYREFQTMGLIQITFTLQMAKDVCEYYKKVILQGHYSPDVLNGVMRF